MVHPNSKPYSGQVFNLPSKTTPDQSLTVKEMIYRYANGMPLDIAQRVGLFDDLDDDDFTVHPANMQNLDLSDVIEMHRDASERINQLRSTLQKRDDELNDDANSSNDNASNIDVSQ